MRDDITGGLHKIIPLLTVNTPYLSCGGKIWLDFNSNSDLRSTFIIIVVYSILLWAWLDHIITSPTAQKLKKK